MYGAGAGTASEASSLSSNACQPIPSSLLLGAPKKCDHQVPWFQTLRKQRHVSVGQGVVCGRRGGGTSTKVFGRAMSEQHETGRNVFHAVLGICHGGNVVDRGCPAVTDPLSFPNPNRHALEWHGFTQQSAEHRSSTLRTPPSCESNPKAPKFDGNNTHGCSDKGVALGRGGGGVHTWGTKRKQKSAHLHAPVQHKRRSNEGTVLGTGRRGEGTKVYRIIALMTVRYSKPHKRNAGAPTRHCSAHPALRRCWTLLPDEARE